MVNRIPRRLKRMQRNINNSQNVSLSVCMVYITRPICGFYQFICSFACFCRRNIVAYCYYIVLRLRKGMAFQVVLRSMNRYLFGVILICPTWILWHVITNLSHAITNEWFLLYTCAYAWFCNKQPSFRFFSVSDIFKKYCKKVNKACKRMVGWFLGYAK